jgi:hypothetical protein
VRRSIATADGPIVHAPRFWFSAEARKSPRIPIGVGVGVIRPK